MMHEVTRGYLGTHGGYVRHCGRKMLLSLLGHFYDAPYE